MAQERLPMRKIKEVLRLKYELGRGHREIARSCRIGLEAPRLTRETATPIRV